MNSVRESIEQWENEYLSPYASFSVKSKGRDKIEKPCSIRPVYQRDRDRILHSKAFRRLKLKTQVFLAPKGDHYRTRLTHTLEVSQIARTMAKALRMNEDLVEAIALGHDLGHTPFGHAGEDVLNEIAKEGFSHYKQSVRIVEKIEKDGKGLNLTVETRDGILNHRTSGNPMTLEGKIVRLSDKIAYINHDIDDSIRAEILKEEDIPYEYSSVLGKTLRERLDILIQDIISNSMGKPDIIMSENIGAAMKGLRKFMFENVYNSLVSKSQDKKAQDLIRFLYEYYLKNKDELPKEYLCMMEHHGESLERIVCDYIAGMTDSYAINKFEELFVPKAWIV